MKSKKLLSVLTAVALSGGAVTTTAIVSPSIVSAAETMADQYDPFYDGTTVRAVPWVELYPQDKKGLPAGTTFSLFDSTSFNPNVFSDGAVMVRLTPSDGELHVWFNSLDTPKVGISTTAFRVIVEYPDGSSETIPVTLNLIPEDTHAYDATYRFISIRTGSEDQLTPFVSNQPDVPFPAGTSFTLTGYYEIDQLRSAGWKFELNSVTGELSVTVPENAEERTIEVPISVIYPDGSRDNTIATMESVGPDDSELYKPDFDLIPIKSGDYIEIDSLATGLPAGTEFHLDYYTLPNRFFDLGGSISLSGNGKFSLEVPLTWNDDLQLPISIIFPDGSSTVENLHVDVTPANFAGNHDVTYTDTTLTAGDTTTITPTTTDLPANTTITLVENTNLNDAHTTGWTIDTTPHGQLTVTAPITATTGIELTLLVAYPDGTEEETTAIINTTPANFAGNHDVTYTDTTLTAGDTTTITPTTTDLPANTTITLVENTNLNDAHTTGWTIDTTPHGQLTVTAPITAGKIQLSVLISYADGTSEVTSVNIEALPKPVVEEPKDDDKDHPQPAPKPSGSSFGSS